MGAKLRSKGREAQVWAQRTLDWGRLTEASLGCRDPVSYDVSEQLETFGF